MKFFDKLSEPTERVFRIQHTNTIQLQTAPGMQEHMLKIMRENLKCHAFSEGYFLTGPEYIQRTYVKKHLDPLIYVPVVSEYADHVLFALACKGRLIPPIFTITDETD